MFLVSGNWVFGKLYSLADVLQIYICRADCLGDYVPMLLQSNTFDDIHGVFFFATHTT